MFGLPGPQGPPASLTPAMQESIDDSVIRRPMDSAQLVASHPGQ